MSKMISVAPGFQYSINIGFDINDKSKLESFIPTQSALSLLEEILLSTEADSNERSRILIGAYGKGKSHIILMILSVLLKKDIKAIPRIMKSIADNPKLLQGVQNYYDSENKILPIVITGSNTSLSQAFLLALKRTLRENEMQDIIPETNYRAAVSVIKRWETDYPDTFRSFVSMIGTPINDFLEELTDFSIIAYEQFERIYPSLTAGSVFNPFLGFDVVELYESVAVELRKKGYTGVYVVYDEFSKYLEANINEASISDTKMLQDFAEKCNRSGALQMHLLLISHKEIANYIDKLPKQKVDGWRGVSERFKHIHLNNNYSQTYEVISSVIQKEAVAWAAFIKQNQSEFNAILHKYESHPLFARNREELETAVFGCYPLHPVSTFILPRLSERIAQNERTLFTYLSSSGHSTLSSFLDRHDDQKVFFVTPDAIFDYFEPLLIKDVYAGELHDAYSLAASILNRLEQGSLEEKIIKTISVIYMLEQFERIKPTIDEIVGIFSTFFSIEEINNAIHNLIEKKFVIYLKRSNGFLRLKHFSGINVKQQINDLSESHFKRISVKQTLNKSNFDSFMYPARYNNEREMTRYFAFVFVDESEVQPDTNWNMKSEAIGADGTIFAVIPRDDDSIPILHQKILKSSKNCFRQVFILPKRYTEITNIASEFEAVRSLRELASVDPIVFEECDVIFEDLQDVITSYITAFSHPEKNKAVYIFNGERIPITRKADLTEKLSQICDLVFSKTPVVNNEAVNRDNLTKAAINSRNKIISALLRNQLEANLGLQGTGQEVSIMRSTLIRTGVLVQKNNLIFIDLRPKDDNISNMLATIERFVLSANSQNKISFRMLYDSLSLPKHQIGLRRGLIPIYLAVVLHMYRQHIVLYSDYGQVPMTADTLLQINADPGTFFLSYVEWNLDIEHYIERLALSFSEYVIIEEKRTNTYDYLVNAMRRWIMSLPKYSKESKIHPNGKQIDRRYVSMMRILVQNTSGYELLFKSLPKALNHADEFSDELVNVIEAGKKCYDCLLDELKCYLISEMKTVFMLSNNKDAETKMSLTSIIREWSESLSADVHNHLFSDGTDKCLALFRSITNDEESFISKLAKLATGLRLEDWDNNTQQEFLTRIGQYRKTAEDFHANNSTESDIDANAYKILYTDREGNSVTRSFEKVKTSSRSNLLYNQITSALESMGQSMAEKEKRQVLMDVLQTLL